MANRRKIQPKEKNRQYDAVYHIRHREERLPKMREYAQNPDQVIYRTLYTRWRTATKGNKLAPNEEFDKPSKETRSNIWALKEKGCAICKAMKDLHLDHKDSHPNHNSKQNLQWLCSTCHKNKTSAERRKGVYSTYEALAKRKRYYR